jgi:hypothetical protein
MSNKGTPNKFQIVFPKIPVSNNLADSKELVLNIFGSVLPGVSIDTIESRWQGMTAMMGGPSTFDDWTVSFIVDNNMHNWIMLFNWLMLICDKKDNPCGDVVDYKIDAYMKMFDNFNKTILNVKFVDVWPKSIGAINLSYREGQSLLESEITFSITRFEIEQK